MSEDLLQIVLDQTDRMLGENVTKEVLSASDRGTWPGDLWRSVEEAGLLHAMVPEARDGIGLSWNDTSALIRRMGYWALPVPLPETIIANWLWCSAGGDKLDGPAAFGPVVHHDRIVVEEGPDGYLLQGTMHHVPWPSNVRQLIVLAADGAGGRRLCLLPAHKIVASGSRLNLAREPRENVCLDGITISSKHTRSISLASVELGLQPYAAAIRAQQIAGGLERSLEFALKYANERVQFGRPIARFQAIQHMLAVAACHVAAATAAADALSQAERLDDALLAIAIAKARCGEAAGTVAAICHQVHGAMGFTQEHSLHFTTRRLWSWRDEGGSETHWQGWIGRAVCAAGSSLLWPTIVDGSAGRSSADMRPFAQNAITG